MADIASITTDQNATVCSVLGATIALPTGFAAFDPVRDALAELVAGESLKPMQACRALGISRSTARRWRDRYGLPGAERKGGSIDAEALAVWLTARGTKIH